MKKIYTLTISTSGYSDRYIYTDLQIIDGEASFANSEKYATYSEKHGIMPYLDAWNKAYAAPATHQIRGKVSLFQTQTITLTDDDRRSIDAYLKTRHGKTTSYTAEAQGRWKEQLENHPITGNLLAIVKWQIAQCDKQNLERWGSVNGQEK